MNCTPPKDKSDQRSSLLLTEKLNKLINEAKKTNKRETRPPAKTTPTSKKAKNESRTPSKTTPTRKRTKGHENHPKITSWLKGDNTSSKKARAESPKKFQALDITVSACSSKSSNTTETVQKKSKKSSKSLKRTPSFEKYGVVVPSFEKILADQRKFEEYKENVKKLDVFDEAILHRKVRNDCLQEEKFTEELLDCKHLTEAELTQHFEQLVPKLEDIKNGKQPSARHQIYNEGSVPTALHCSTSMAVFKYEQIEHLLSLLRLEFDPEDKMTSYFFKVLLPELCLFIFMAVHEMKRKKAEAYLDKRPIDL